MLNASSPQVTRKSTGTVLFDTNDMPGFVYSDQFIQLATNLPSTFVYGLGENEQPTYRHDLNWKTWTGFARWDCNSISESTRVWEWQETLRL